MGSSFLYISSTSSVSADLAAGGPGSALFTGVGYALALASLTSAATFLSNLFLISTYGVLVGALSPPTAFPLAGAGVAVPTGFGSVGFFKPILVVGLLMPLAAVAGLAVPFTALLVSLAAVRGVFCAFMLAEAGDASDILFAFSLGTTEGLLACMLDAVEEDSVGGRADFKGSAVDGLLEAIDEELLGFSMFSTNY